MPNFETCVVIGKGLAAMSQGVKDWGLRDCFGQLEEYLYSKESDRVCLIFGLQWTGKVSMLWQAIAQMNKENLSRTSYIKARRSDTMAMMNRDLKKEFVEDYIFPTIQAGAVYEGKYLLGTSFAPVSYTHLDVYKRQDYRRAYDARPCASVGEHTAQI